MYWSLQALAAATGQGENVRLAGAPLVMLCIPPRNILTRLGRFITPRKWLVVKVIGSQEGIHVATSEYSTPDGRPS
jgi:hypothetical protein